MAKAVLREARTLGKSRAELGATRGKTYEDADVAWCKKHLPLDKQRWRVTAHDRHDAPINRGLTQDFTADSTAAVRSYARALIEQGSVAVYCDYEAYGWSRYRNEMTYLGIYQEVYEPEDTRPGASRLVGGDAGWR